LLAYRADRGWSQARLVEESGVAGATIAHIETRANKNPRRITLMRLAQAFGVSLDEFLSDRPPKAPVQTEALPLRLEWTYDADDASREQALEAATTEERAVYVGEIDAAMESAEQVLRGPEESLTTDSRLQLRRYVSLLVALRDEATATDAAPPTLQQAKELLHA
jgi:transcriptional regulator with XRE-family HTH domain